MTNKSLEITPQTIVGDLLNAYPQLENTLIEISPVFERLKNPVLRRTVAKLATLKQAAAIASISVAELINKLRKAANQSEMKIEDEENAAVSKPGWVKKENVKYEYNAGEDIENGLHPAAKVMKDVLLLKQDELYLLITPFVPAPLIGILEEKGFKTYTEKLSENTFHTFVAKTLNEDNVE